jgi:uncharacterized protein YqgV (UPF0045/DUF77 family)
MIVAFSVSPSGGDASTGAAVAEAIRVVPLTTVIMPVAFR